MKDTYNSTDDRRATDACPTESTTGSVAGGAFRAKYRALDGHEKALIDRIKVKAEEMYALIMEADTDLGGEGTRAFPVWQNNILAFRHLEDAVYRVVKHVTREK